MSTKYKTYDNSSLYFISCAVVGWVDVFTRPQYKKIFTDNLQFCVKNKNLELYAWVLMSNHFHLIARSSVDGLLLSEILRDFKKFTSKALKKEIESNNQESRKEWMQSIFRISGLNRAGNNDFQFWQHDNHPFELFSQDLIKQKLDYIHNNPVKQEIVLEPHHYLYSSAIDYSGAKGLIDIVYV